MAVTRMAVAWCPDWPVVAWGVPLDEPAAVVVANRVIATSPAARADGVAVGQRRRDAQGRCPEVAILERDVDREARRFEPVAMALEALTPRVEVVGPGLLGFPTRGPSRFLGGDEALAAEMAGVVEPVLASQGARLGATVRIGIADGAFAARLAARATAARMGPVIVEPGESPAFLHDLPIGTLPGVEDLVSVLARLGLTTLGRFASLSTADVVGRFGLEGLLAHRLARGEDQHPPDLRKPAADLAVTWIFEPAAERIDRCAFAAKALADELHERLAADGLACTRVAIEAETERGDCHVRLWRDEGALSSAALAERARWQLDGWLQVKSAARVADHQKAAGIRPEPVEGVTIEELAHDYVDEGGHSGDGIARLTLIPDEVVPASGRQLGFWGGRAERADDVTRAVARLQGLLGPEAVSVPERCGGRGPGEQLRLIPAAAVDLGEPRVATEAGWVQEPWPGGVPRPAPSQVLFEPLTVSVLDGAGRPVGVTGRGEISAPPSMVVLPVPRGRPGQPARPGRPRQVTAWVGPWPADERWWDELRHRRRARLQVTLEDHSAHLLMIEGSEWWLEATYG